MANYVYGAIALTGGGTGALDAIDGADLLDNDSAIVFTGTATYMYQLDSSSGASENEPLIIAPDSNPGDKRWLLLESVASTVSLNTTSFDKFLSSNQDDVQKLADALNDAFSSASFTVSEGSVALLPSVVKEVKTNGADLTIGSNSISVLGAGKLSTSGSGSTLTITLANLTVNTQTTNYIILATDDVVIGDCSGGNVQLTLPAANAKDLIRIFKKSASNTLTIVRAGSDTIEGSTSINFSGEYQSVTLVSNGSNTWVQF